MTNHSSLHTGPAAVTPGASSGIEELDQSPHGLADAPASQQDPDSIVYVGNS